MQASPLGGERWVRIIGINDAKIDENKK